MFYLFNFFKFCTANLSLMNLHVAVLFLSIYLVMFISRPSSWLAEQQRMCVCMYVCTYQVATDGLIIKGWYQTITLAVYGKLTTVIQDRASPPPPPPPQLRSKPPGRCLIRRQYQIAVSVELMRSVYRLSKLSGKSVLSVIIKSDNCDS